VDQRNTEVVHSEHDSINTARAQRVQWCLLAMCGQQEQLMYDGETDEVYGGQLFKCCNTEYSFSMFDLLMRLLVLSHLPNSINTTRAASTGS